MQELSFILPKKAINVYINAFMQALMLFAALIGVIYQGESMATGRRNWT